MQNVSRTLAEIREETRQIIEEEKSHKDPFAMDSDASSVFRKVAKGDEQQELGASSTGKPITWKRL